MAQSTSRAMVCVTEYSSASNARTLLFSALLSRLCYRDVGYTNAMDNTSCAQPGFSHVESRSHVSVSTTCTQRLWLEDHKGSGRKEEWVEGASCAPCLCVGV